ncbi:hypothetical protein F4604DRAFT_1688462 [Suillus subluteus]|nr:hypothetical protein F4604DRAFT_1688462 [Suillus subluteus]
MVMRRGHALQAHGKPVKGSPSQKSEVSQRGQQYHSFTQETQEGVLSLARRCTWNAVIILLQDASSPTKEYLYILTILLSTFEYNGIAQCLAGPCNPTFYIRIITAPIHAILLSTVQSVLFAVILASIILRLAGIAGVQVFHLLRFNLCFSAFHHRGTHGPDDLLQPSEVTDELSTPDSNSKGSRLPLLHPGSCLPLLHPGSRLPLLHPAHWAYLLEEKKNEELTGRLELEGPGNVPPFLTVRALRVELLLVD